MKNFISHYILAIAVLMGVCQSGWADEFSIWEGNLSAGDQQDVSPIINKDKISNARQNWSNCSIHVSDNAQGWYQLATPGWEFSLDDGHKSLTLDEGKWSVLQALDKFVLKGGNGSSITRIYISGTPSQGGGDPAQGGNGGNGNPSYSWLEVWSGNQSSAFQITIPDDKLYAFVEGAVLSFDFDITNQWSYWLGCWTNGHGQGSEDIMNWGNSWGPQDPHSVVLTSQLAETLRTTKQLNFGLASITVKKVYVSVTPDIEEDVPYYIQNVESGLFLGGANHWGTQATVMEHGQKFSLSEVSDGVYTLTNTEISVTNKTLGYNLFVDTDTSKNGNQWTIEKVTGEPGVYTIHGQGKKDNVDDAFNAYLAQSATEGNVGFVAEGVAEKNDAAKWRFLTKERAIEQLAGATENSPKNATFLIANASFDRYHETTVWSHTGECTLTGGNNAYACAESKNSAFDAYQQLSGIPNGIYKLTAQCFYNNYSGSNVPVLYANNKTRDFLYRKEADSSINGMTNASEQFKTGEYTVSPIYIRVTDGNLKVGVKKTTQETISCWWDNFQLEYCGEVDFLTLVDDSPAWNGSFTLSDLNGEQIFIEKTALSNLPDGNVTIEVTYNNNNTAGSLLFQCANCDGNSYVFNQDLTAASGDQSTSISLTADQLTHVKGDGSTTHALKLTGNNIDVKGITLKVDRTFTSSGHTENYPLASWRNNLWIPKTAFVGLSSGATMLIRCTYDGSENNGWDGILQFGASIGSNWGNDFTSNFSGTVGYNSTNKHINFGNSGTRDVEIPLTSAALDAVRGIDDNLLLHGQNLTINSITLRDVITGNGEDPVGTPLWTGSTTLDWNAQPQSIRVEIAKTAFAGVTPGSTMHIYYISDNNDAKIQLNCNNGYDYSNNHYSEHYHSLKLNASNPVGVIYNDQYNYYSVGSGNNHLSVELTEDLLNSHLKNGYNANTFFIQGERVMITGVYVEIAAVPGSPSATISSLPWVNDPGFELSWQNLERAYMKASVLKSVAANSTMTIAYTYYNNNAGDNRAQIQLNACHVEPWQAQHLASETPYDEGSHVYQLGTTSGTLTVTLNNVFLSQISSLNDDADALAIMGDNLKLTGVTISAPASPGDPAPGGDEPNPGLGGSAYDRMVIWDFNRDGLEITGKTAQMLGAVNGEITDNPSYALTIKRSSSETYTSSESDYYSCPASKKGTNCFSFKTMSQLFGLEVKFTSSTTVDPQAYLTTSPTGTSIKDLSFVNGSSYIWNDFAVTPDQDIYLCFKNPVDIKFIALVSSSNVLPVFVENLENEYAQPSALMVSTLYASIFTWYECDINSMTSGTVIKAEEGRNTIISSSVLPNPKVGKYYYCKVEDKYNSVILHSNIAHIVSISSVEAKSTQPKLYYEYLPEGIRASIYANGHDVRYTNDGTPPTMSSNPIAQNASHVAYKKFSTNPSLMISAPAPEGKELKMYSWQIMYHLANTLEHNSTYRLRMRAATNTVNGFDVAFWPFENKDGGKTIYHLPTRRVENEWQDETYYSWDFSTNDYDITDLQWAIGGLNGDMFIDHIELYKLGSPTGTNLIANSDFNEAVTERIDLKDAAGWWKHSWHSNLHFGVYGETTSTVATECVDNGDVNGTLVSEAAPTLGQYEMAYTIANKIHSHTTHPGILSFDINTSNYVDGGEIETKGLEFSTFRGTIDITYRVAPSTNVKFTPKELYFYVNQWNATDGKIDWSVSINNVESSSGTDVVPEVITSAEGWTKIALNFGRNAENEGDRLTNGATIKVHVETKNLGSTSYIGLANTTLVGSYYSDDRAVGDLACSGEENVDKKAVYTYTTSCTGEVTVTSTDPDVALVVHDAENKTITVYGAATGSTFITIHQEGDANYKPISISKAVNIQNAALVANSLYYSFNDDESPRLTPGTNVNLDYSHTSVITGSNFLNAWIGASITHPTIIPLDKENLSNDVWYLDFDWACYGGTNGSSGNGYRGNTSLNIENGGNNISLFSILDAALGSTNSVLSYHNYTNGENQNSNLSIYPTKNDGSRASTETGNRLNTVAYWYHFSLKGSEKGVFLTVYMSNDINLKVLDNVQIYNKNVVLKNLTIQPGNCGSVAIDELHLRKESELALFSRIVGADGANRTMELSCDIEGTQIHYNTYSADPNAYFRDYSTDFVTTDQPHVFAYASFDGILKTEIYDFPTGAGITYKLNTPTISTRSYDDNTKQYNVAFGANRLDEGLNPEVTYHYSVNGSAEQTGASAIIDAGATISVYATATGFGDSDPTFFTAPLAGTKWSIDFTADFEENGISLSNGPLIDNTYYRLVKNGQVMNENFGVHKVKDGDRFWAHGNALYLQTAGFRDLVFANVRRGQYIRITSSLEMESAENAVKIENSYGNVEIYRATADGTIKIKSPRYNYIQKVEVLSELFYQVPSATCEGYSVFYDPENDYQVPNGIEVFTAVDRGTYIRLNKVPSGYIPANNAVVLKGATTTPFYMSLEKIWDNPELAPVLPDNELEGTDVATLVENLTEKDYVYVLGNKKDGNGGYLGAGFGLFSKTKTLPARKAYLDCYNQPSQAPVLYFVAPEDEEEMTTGIEQLETEFSEHVYDLDGRVVEKPVSGNMYIYKGNLIIVK